ncbi:MAG: hypothetical protein PHQ12_07450 [Chthoniobacteraceae bacterium]|nr:hypothetical protein [Chthoniobacteraceae bacterium]
MPKELVPIVITGRVTEKEFEELEAFRQGLDDRTMSWLVRKCVMIGLAKLRRDSSKQPKVKPAKSPKKRGGHSRNEASPEQKP